MADHLERHHSSLMSTPLLGPFVKGGICATAAWWLVWPFENLKNQVQARTAGVDANASWAQRAAHVVRQSGLRGLYRGILPGTLRSVIANGASMAVFTSCQAAQRKRRQAKGV